MRTVFATLVLAVAMFARPLPVFAGSEVLSGSALTSFVSGKVVYVSTSTGSMPIRYSSNGTMSASSGGIGKLTGLGSDTGKWWVKGSRLCQRWTTWLEAKTHCVTVRKAGGKVHWTSTSGKSGTATVGK